MIRRLKRLQLSAMNSFRGALGFRRLAILLIAVSCITWSCSLLLSHFRIGPLGIIEGLSPLYFVAISLLVSVFFASIYKGGISKRFLALQFALIVIFFLAIPLAIEESPRFPYNFNAYYHIDYILQTGRLDPQGMPYQSWPGVFVLGTVIINVTGIGPVSLIQYAPIILGILILPLGYLLLKTFLRSEREIWAGMLISGVIFWGSSCYFLPGFLAGLVSLFLIVFLVRFEIIERRKSVAFRGAMIVLMFALTISHLLTSVQLLFLLLVLVPTLRIMRIKSNFVSLLLLMASIVAAWQIYVVGSYSLTIISSFLKSMLDYDSTISAVSQIGFGGSSEHAFVVIVRIVSAGGFTILAIAGFIFGLRRELRKPKGSRELLDSIIIPVWIAANASMILLTSYGGEIVSRVFGSSISPLTVSSAKTISSKYLAIPLICILIVFPSISVINSYGNEAVDYISPQEISGVLFVSEASSIGAKVGSVDYRIWGLAGHNTIAHQRVNLSSFWNGSKLNTDLFVVSIREIEASNFLSGGSIEFHDMMVSVEGRLTSRIYSEPGFVAFRIG